MARRPWTLVLTCEHGGNDIPVRWRKYLTVEDQKLLPTHRGWDIGALAIAQGLERALHCPLFFATKSRLLVDLNRSAHHPNCLGPSFRELDRTTQDEILETAYFPYRQGVEEHLRSLIQQGKRVFHLSVHSFTPVLKGEVRNADIAMLYDPKRKLEVQLAEQMIQGLRAELPAFKYRRNYPYLGISDAFVTMLRKVLPERNYAGLEIEINQKWLGTKEEARELVGPLVRALQNID